MNTALNFYFPLKWGNDSCDYTNEIVKALCKIQCKGKLQIMTLFLKVK